MFGYLKRLFVRDNEEIAQLRRQCEELKKMVGQTRAESKMNNRGPYGKRMNAHDLIGQRFGKLEVIALISAQDSPSDKYFYYRCTCDCGGTYVTTRYPLKSGNAFQCNNCTNALRKKNGRNRYTSRTPDNIIGNRYGRIVVTKRLTAAKGVSRYFQPIEYQCDCGYIGKTTADNLKNKCLNYCRECHKKHMAEKMKELWSRGGKDAGK